MDNDRQINAGGPQVPAQNSAKYHFTNNWFAPNIPVWDQLLSQLNPKRILEIGSYEGYSTCYLIEKCTDVSAIEIHCVDTWQGGIEHQKSSMLDVENRFHANVQFAQQKSKNPASVQIHKCLSYIALSEFLAAKQAGTFDLAYVDGSHQATDVLVDAVLSFQLLRVGGLMIFDDYLWHSEPDGRQDPFNMPKPAVDAFINIFQRKLKVVEGVPLRQIVVRKV